MVSDLSTGVEYTANIVVSLKNNKNARIIASQIENVACVSPAFVITSKIIPRPEI